jgi:hypothetical protein
MGGGGMKLERYDAARRALAEATRVDEVKSIRDKAVAMKVYAAQAKDITLIARATQLRMRSERRAGELLIEMKAKGERQKAGENRRGVDSRAAQPSTPKLSDLGVSKTQSSRWQKLAGISDDEFESKVDIATHQAVASIERARKQQKKPSRKKAMHNAVKTFGPFDACALRFRQLIADVMTELQPGQWPQLLEVLRQEFSSIETMMRGGGNDDRVDASRDAGHHTNGQPA